ncbi:MAG TPA: hypothetical protein DCY20_08380 [Firmicutes bacterium]|nr:hypothetical protein [Bacillota bacterium]
MTINRLNLLQGSIINYEIAFTMPVNSNVSGVVIKDTLPAGFGFPTGTYPVDYYPLIKITREGTAVTVTTATSFDAASNVLTITFTDNASPLAAFVVAAGEAPSFKIEVPVLVTDLSKAILNPDAVPSTSPVEYATLNSATVALQVGSETGTPSAPIKDYTNFIPEYNSLAGGHVDMANNVNSKAYMNASFNLVDSLVGTDTPYTISYDLKVTLPTNTSAPLQPLAYNITTDTPLYVVAYNGTDTRVLSGTEYTVTPTGETVLTISLPYTVSLRRVVITAYVPYKINEAYTTLPTPPVLLQQFDLKTSSDSTSVTNTAYATTHLYDVIPTPIVTGATKKLQMTLN